jgi:DNA repair photolyase
MPANEQPGLFASPVIPAAPPLQIPGAIVRETSCRSVLNRSGDGHYSFNCYTGCLHACVYCYARFMQRFHPHQEPWGKFVDVKVNAPAILAKQLQRLPPGSVFTCSACDGWQSIEAHYQLTRRCCQLLLNAKFHLEILTKSDLVLRDLDILAGSDAKIGVTMTTPDEAQAQLWEPEASSVAARLNVLKQAKRAGLRTTVMFGPLLPGISDTPPVLARLFALAAEAKVDRIWTDALNPRPRVWPAVQDLLRRHYPHLLDDYRRILFDPAARANYLDDLHERVHRAAAAAGLVHLLA